MDTVISKSDQQKKKNKNLMKWVAVILLAAILFFVLRNQLKRKADEGKFLISTVEMGDIQNTISATGLVIPSYERVINAPVNTEIKNVKLKRGDEVRIGSLIMELDRAYTILEYEKLKDELDLKRNSINRLKLEFDKDLVDIDLKQQLKGLQLSELEAEIKDQKKLNKVGGATNEEVEKAELNLKQAAIEKKMLLNELKFKQQANVPDKKNLELEFQIQAKRLAELRKKLNETSVYAPSDGVITWINEDIGKTVNVGEPLVKIADLKSFRIEASSSDRNSDHIKVGAIVNVRINNTTLTGTISSVLPAVENNTIKFLVELDKTDSKLLKPNLKVEIFIVSDKKSNVLRIQNGEAFNGAKTQDVFVVQGDKAVKRTIEKGLSSTDYVEILSGVKAGDRIIITETEEYKNMNEFILNKKN
ncbi:MAG: HlyD family efflux transporter periplasmic adaptor subunit [Saprospiraceae bacterium]|jgi:HlyD family secretion protein|nr:HlyD family efflux transporter periplasmic adaptor subunit [Candidatus Brachybacter algidus]